MLTKEESKQAWDLMCKAVFGVYDDLNVILPGNEPTGITAYSGQISFSLPMLVYAMGWHDMEPARREDYINEEPDNDRTKSL